MARNGFEKELLLKIGNIEGTLESLVKTNTRDHKDLKERIDGAFRKLNKQEKRLGDVEDDLIALNKDFSWGIRITRGVFTLVQAVIIVLIGWIVNKI